MTWEVFIKSKITTWLLVGALFFVGFISIRILLQKHAVDTEIQKLQAEADKIHHENQQLSSLIKYMNTPQFEETQAREKLNLKKDGETVVVLPPDSQTDPSTLAAAKPVPNTKQWFDYFFKTPWKSKLEN